MTETSDTWRATVDWPFTQPAGDAQLDTLELIHYRLQAYDPVLGNHSEDRCEVALTVRAETADDAAGLAVALVQEATGARAEVRSVEALTPQP